MGALIAVELGEQRLDLERDLMGLETKRHANGGVEIASAYDVMDRLVEQKATAPSTAGAAVNDVLVERVWRYNAAGRVHAISDKRWGTTRYAYDDLGQLIEAKRGAFAEVFHYDGIGSLQAVLKTLSEREDAGLTWDIGTGNVLHSTKVAHFTNDVNHRRSTMTDDKTGAVTEYLWDCRDRLREVRFPDGRRALYTYDAFGRRVRKEIVPKVAVADLAKGKGPAVQVTEFLWDGNALAAELSTEHGARVHVHEPGTLVPVLQAEQGEVFAVVCDHLGMPKELLGRDGRIAWAAAHSAWGQVVEVKGRPTEKGGRPIESPFRLLGQYADEETGLCYTRFRYFDPQHARWLSPDPLGIVGGKNLLAFGGTPTVDVDPWGLACGNWGKFKNLKPEDNPRAGSFASKLVFEDGRWRESTPSGAVGTPKGSYNFVRMGDDLLIGRGGSRDLGHIDLSGGDPVDYAGTIRFNKRGELVGWDNWSGHYQPDAGSAGQAGLPMDRFNDATHNFPGPSQKPS